MPLLRIGQLAKATGFTAKTLRYYEDLRLLRPVARTASGYRLYPEDAVTRLQFVRRAKGLGLSLHDIGAILEISDEGRLPCKHVMAVVDRDLARIDAQLARLRSLKHDLLSLQSRLKEALASGTAAPGAACPCFEEHSGSEPAPGNLEARPD